ncbi:hypothetical protein FTO70_07370 [Methanosarcina sp. KYL-1]|uniref:hypothetical protein n=1 Tax=Methanosarcina sp. KYL-1 TaxID=2602068 RepID=UPI002100DA54|nr:hypothetical protein [Methanosarcina sp. KYL-1]MCQ1535506.1 hypothetical protein [Methanosarcina sp. KYL-1]
MVLETHLIKISPDASLPQIQEVLKTVLMVGGRIEMASGKTIIASFDNAYSDLVKKKKGVELVGAVNFRGRKIQKVVKKVSRKEGSNS